MKSVNKSSHSAANASNERKKTVTFNMATLVVSSALSLTSNMIGPLVDDGAPYSAIGLVKLKDLAKKLGLSSNWKMAQIPSVLEGHSHWQYGTGDHASPTRRIMGSIILTATSDTGRPVDITHLVLEGSSQWVIGRNVTRKANIEHINRNAIAFMVNDQLDYISITNSGFLSYVQIDMFCISHDTENVLECLSGSMLEEKSWSEVKAIIEKVHKHVCGHANYADLQLLLERNELRNGSVASYVHQLIESCSACHSSAPPQPNRKVSISSLSRAFNEIVCVDHFYLDAIRLMHCMDLGSRLSTVHVVHTATISEAVIGFEACWVPHFGYPESIHGDKAFDASNFKSYMKERDISFRPVPPGRHSKNTIESKHNVIRSIYLRLKQDKGDSHKATLVLLVCGTKGWPGQ